MGKVVVDLVAKVLFETPYLGPYLSLSRPLSIPYLGPYLSLSRPLSIPYLAPI